MIRKLHPGMLIGGLIPIQVGIWMGLHAAAHATPTARGWAMFIGVAALGDLALGLNLWLAWRRVR